MLDYVHRFLEALLFSAVIEGAVVLALCAVFKKEKWISWIAVFGTLCTIPYVWFVFPTLFWYAAGLGTFIAESFALLFEAALYRVIGKLNWRNALLFSFIANAISYGLPRLFGL
jgi:hypothetical protein